MTKTPPHADNVPEQKKLPRKKLSFWQSMRIVGWGFLGVRKNSGYQDDLGRANPFHVILAGLLGFLLFIAALLLIVKWVVSTA